MPQLQTARLTIFPFTADLMRAALRAPAEAGRLLDVQIPAGWPNSDEAEILPMLADRLDREPARLNWGMHLFIRAADRALVGGGGYHGPPGTDGAVTIGYGIAPEHQGRGYATEGARALIAWAFAQPGLRRIIADCDPHNAASIRVLEKLGMARLPPTNGLLNWELRRESWALPTDR